MYFAILISQKSDSDSVVLRDVHKSCVGAGTTFASHCPEGHGVHSTHIASPIWVRWSALEKKKNELCFDYLTVTTQNLLYPFV